MNEDGLTRREVFTAIVAPVAAIGSGCLEEEWEETRLELEEDNSSHSETVNDTEYNFTYSNLDDYSLEITVYANGTEFFNDEIFSNEIIYPGGSEEVRIQYDSEDGALYIETRS